jgi:hypothetical protein
MKTYLLIVATLLLILGLAAWSSQSARALTVYEERDNIDHVAPNSVAGKPGDAGKVRAFLDLPLRGHHSETFPMDATFDTPVGYSFMLACVPSSLPQTKPDPDSVQFIEVEVDRNNSANTFGMLVTHVHHSGKRSARVGPDGAYELDQLKTKYWIEPKTDKPVWSWLWSGGNKKNRNLYIVGVINRDLDPHEFEWTYHEYLKKLSDPKFEALITEGACKRTDTDIERSKFKF